MKTLTVFAVFFTLLVAPLGAQDCDNPQSLEWVKQQARVIDKGLASAILSNNWSDLQLRLTEAEESFALITNAGLCCEELLVAAEKGRRYSMLLANVDNDMNAYVERATKARIQAIRMSEAAAACMRLNEDLPLSAAYSTTDALLYEIELIRTDLNASLETRDLRKAVPNIEHALRVLNDTQRLAGALEQCDALRQAARLAYQHCTNALLAKTWTEAEKYLFSAYEQLGIMQGAVDCRL